MTIANEKVLFVFISGFMASIYVSDEFTNAFYTFSHICLQKTHFGPLRPSVPLSVCVSSKVLADRFQAVVGLPPMTLAPCQFSFNPKYTFLAACRCFYRSKPMGSVPTFTTYFFRLATCFFLLVVPLISIPVFNFLFLVFQVFLSCGFVCKMSMMHIGPLVRASIYYSFINDYYASFHTGVYASMGLISSSFPSIHPSVRMFIRFSHQTDWKDF